MRNISRLRTTSAFLVSSPCLMSWQYVQNYAWFGAHFASVLFPTCHRDTLDEGPMLERRIPSLVWQDFCSSGSVRSWDNLSDFCRRIPWIYWLYLWRWLHAYSSWGLLQFPHLDIWRFLLHQVFDCVGCRVAHFGFVYQWHRGSRIWNSKLRGFKLALILFLNNNQSSYFKFCTSFVSLSFQNIKNNIILIAAL